MLEDAGLILRNEGTEVLRCLRALLREPAFAGALALLVSGDGQTEECEIAGRSRFGAPLQMARATSARNTSSPVQRDFVAFTAIVHARYELRKKRINGDSAQVRQAALRA